MSASSVAVTRRLLPAPAEPVMSAVRLDRRVPAAPVAVTPAHAARSRADSSACPAMACDRTASPYPGGATCGFGIAAGAHTGRRGATMIRRLYVETTARVQCMIYG